MAAREGALHSPGPVSQLQIIKVQCELCKVKIKANSYKRHMKTQHDLGQGKKWQCQLCPKILESKARFKFQEFLKISEHSLQRAWLGPFLLFFLQGSKVNAPSYSLDRLLNLTCGGERKEGKRSNKENTWGDSNVVLVSFSVYLLVSCKIPLLQERFSTVRTRSVLGFVGIFLFLVHRQDVPIQVLFVSGFIVTLFTL